MDGDSERSIREAGSYFATVLSISGGICGIGQSLIAIEPSRKVSIKAHDEKSPRSAAPQSQY
jgi:hypothetical protein